ncbi:MAG: arsenate reductase (azurin) small subunit [Myxococcales bacterium]|nr:arsenate reductase (azurin) small subunit [Myxococcales bacterium]
MRGRRVVDIDRRQLLGGAAAALAASAATEARAESGAVRVGELSALTPDRPLWFGYPDGRSPAVALKLGARVPGGIGPDGDVVAFSAVCTHLGCVVEVRDHRMVCPCHLSMFDPRVGGRCYQGPAPTGLARIRLRLEDGVLHAVGADGEVWGR